jgi:hypothetical protein
MKYAANYQTTNGTHLAKPILGSNLGRIRRRIRDIAADERQAGQRARFWVYLADGMQPIVSGSINEQGKVEYQDPSII